MWVDLRIRKYSENLRLIVSIKFLFLTFKVTLRSRFDNNWNMKHEDCDGGTNVFTLSYQAVDIIIFIRNIKRLILRCFNIKHFKRPETATFIAPKSLFFCSPTSHCDFYINSNLKYNRIQQWRNFSEWKWSRLNSNNICRRFNMCRFDFRTWHHVWNLRFLIPRLLAQRCRQNDINKSRRNLKTSQS